MGKEFGIESYEGGKESEGWSLFELGSGVLVASVSAYIACMTIPQTDNYIATNVAPKIAGSLILWSRLGYGLMVSAAGTGAAWAAGYLQKKI